MLRARYPQLLPSTFDDVFPARVTSALDMQTPALK
jgi:hypothetical protein